MTTAGTCIAADCPIQPRMTALQGIVTAFNDWNPDRRDVEIARLRALSQNNAHSWDAIVKERDGLRAEVERLRVSLVAIERVTWQEGDDFAKRIVQIRKIASGASEQ